MLILISRNIGRPRSPWGVGHCGSSHWMHSRTLRSPCSFLIGSGSIVLLDCNLVLDILDLSEIECLLSFDIHDFLKVLFLYLLHSFFGICVVDLSLQTTAMLLFITFVSLFGFYGRIVFHSIVNGIELLRVHQRLFLRTKFLTFDCLC